MVYETRQEREMPQEEQQQWGLQQQQQQQQGLQQIKQSKFIFNFYAIKMQTKTLSGQGASKTERETKGKRRKWSPNVKHETEEEEKEGKRGMET